MRHSHGKEKVENSGGDFWKVQAIEFVDSIERMNYMFNFEILTSV